MAHRQEMNGELSSLVARSQTALKEQTELEQLKLKMAPLLREMSSLSERLLLAEQREQALLERMRYSKDQMEALSDLAQDYRRRLEDQALRAQLDPLTKVYNRSSFTERLEHEYRRWIRTQHNLRVVLFDIDKFKSINDSFGYTAGDKALSIIARTIKKNYETVTPWLASLVKSSFCYCLNAPIMRVTRLFTRSAQRVETTVQVPR